MANHEQIMTSGGGGGGGAANRDAAKKIGHEIVQMAQIQSSKNYTCLPVVAPPNGPQMSQQPQPHPHQLQQQQHQYQQMSHQTGPYGQMTSYPSMPVENNNPNNTTGSPYEPYGTGNSGLNGNVYENNGNNGYTRMMMPTNQMGAQLPSQQSQQYYNSYAR